MEKKKKKCALSFHGIHVTCYIKFELLYKFRIVTFSFFFFSKYKYNVYIKNLNFKVFWIFIISIAFLEFRSLISSVYFVCIFYPKIKDFVPNKIKSHTFQPKN